MEKLNLPDFEFKINKSSSGKLQIFDELRKKYVALTPEEWVRQNFIKFLVEHRNFPKSLIAVEKGLTVNKQNKRFDAVAYNNLSQPVMLMEFKAPGVKISQKVFEQIANYNRILKVKYLVVSNGIKHYCCKINFNDNEIEFLNNIPYFENLT